MSELGFVAGQTSPCLFRSLETDVRGLVHGDDFVTLGRPEHLDALRAQLGARWLIKERGMLGRDVQEISILNRLLRRVRGGYELEADPKHARLLARGLGLQSNSRGVTTPGVHNARPDHDSPLPDDAVTPFRSAAMRGAYLALDRPELSFTIKELSRGMAKPTAEDAQCLRRLARYLLKEPRLVQRFPWQSLPPTLRVEVDSDFAGCCRSRKSTSGFVALLGRHCLVTKCKHQSIIALSSGEAEFYSLVSGLARGLGIH